MIATDCFALLDDVTASSSDPKSRLYTAYLRTLSCQHASELPALFDSMQAALQSGQNRQYAVALFSYELGADLLTYPQPSSINASSAPLVQILLFQNCTLLSAAQLDDWLSAQQANAINESSAGIANLSTSINQNEFDQAMTAIHAYIEAGDVYQVNYTYRIRFDAFGDVANLYRQLRARQAVPYGALLSLPDGGAVLSFSPELFMRHRHGKLTVQPMKGTAAATGNVQEDIERAESLSKNAKNCAENLMIVDLLRNDLGRIAKIGTVQVPAMFEVQGHGSVLQMTSTIEAQIDGKVTLFDIFSALYPCGSITGAPKRRAMEIIQELEPDARGLYTGAIGWFDAVSDFCLSIPIRTLVLQAPNAQGVRLGEMGVGSGIVHDSDAADEYSECALKARFLTDLPHDFELFETMYATQIDGCRYIEQHLQRLCSSAAYFGFTHDVASLRKTVQDYCLALPSSGAHRVRLALNQAGVCTIQSAPLIPFDAENLPVKLLLAMQPMVSNDLFLRHKTTVRQRYDEAWCAAEEQGAFDMLFCNTQGELTEGGRSSVFVKLDGRWYTPPLSAGLLPGVMRAQILQDPLWNACERRLTLADLHAAQAVMVCNALRGPLPAIVINND